MDQFNEIEYYFEVSHDTISIERKDSKHDSNDFKAKTFNIQNNKTFDKFNHKLKTVRENSVVKEEIDLGMTLYEILLISPEIEAKFLEDMQQKFVKINIVTKMSQYIDLPWELLYSKKFGFLLLRDNVSISRNIPIDVTAPSTLIDSKIKLLLIAPSPGDEKDVRKDLEFNAIKDEIDNDFYEIDILPKTTVELLKTKMSEGQYHILHFIGHGGIVRGDGYILLDNNTNKSYWLSPQELTTILPSSVKLICLSSGYTFKNYNIEAFNIFCQFRGDHRLPNLIANQFQTNEKSNRIFWKEFYESVRKDGKLDTAVGRGRRAIHEKLNSDSQLGWSSFVLHLRNNNKIFSIITKKKDYSSLIPTEKANEIKGLEVQMDLFSGIINDISNQINTSESQKNSLSKVVNEIKDYHTRAVSKYRDLTNTIEKDEEIEK